MCEALEAHAGESHPSASSGVAWRLRGSSDEGYLLVREIEPIREPEAMCWRPSPPRFSCLARSASSGWACTSPGPCLHSPREFWLAQQLQKPQSYWRTLVRLSVGESVYRHLPALRAEREARALARVQGAANARLVADSPMHRLSELVWPEVYLSCE